MPIFLVELRITLKSFVYNSSDEKIHQKILYKFMVIYNKPNFKKIKIKN